MIARRMLTLAICSLLAFEAMCCTAPKDPKDAMEQVKNVCAHDDITIWISRAATETNDNEKSEPVKSIAEGNVISLDHDPGLETATAVNEPVKVTEESGDANVMNIEANSYQYFNDTTQVTNSTIDLPLDVAAAEPSSEENVDLALDTIALFSTETDVVSPTHVEESIIDQSTEALNTNAQHQEKQELNCGQTIAGSESIDYTSLKEGYTIEVRTEIAEKHSVVTEGLTENMASPANSLAVTLDDKNLACEKTSSQVEESTINGGVHPFIGPLLEGQTREELSNCVKVPETVLGSKDSVNAEDVDSKPAATEIMSPTSSQSINDDVKETEDTNLVELAEHLQVCFLRNDSNNIEGKTNEVTKADAAINNDSKNVGHPNVNIINYEAAESKEDEKVTTSALI